MKFEEYVWREETLKKTLKTSQHHSPEIEYLTAKNEGAERCSRRNKRIKLNKNLTTVFFEAAFQQLTLSTTDDVLRF